MQTRDGQVERNSGSVTQTGTGGEHPLRAGVAKVDITNVDAGPVHDPLYAKALVLRDDVTSVAIVTVDAVAIAEIGSIRNEFLANVRVQLRGDPGLEPTHLIVNASHCHGSVCADVEARVVRAVREAWASAVPVTVGSGAGHEDRIMENRRLRLKDGREADVRHAYSLAPDEQVEAVGPVDPEIGLLRLDRLDGETLAVMYNFACHPIQGVPDKGNTADLAGFASTAIETNLSDGAVALFLQGCAGDVNPVMYKDVDHPRDAEPLGNRLGLSALRGLRGVRCTEGAVLRVIHEILELPRADLVPRIEALEAQRTQLLESLRGTSLNLKTFMPLMVKVSLSPDFPSYASHRYLHDRGVGRDDLDKLDADNRRELDRYVANILTMEELTRVQTNLALLRMHRARDLSEGTGTIRVEVVGLRIGDLVLITFPGELSVQIGLGIKERSPHRLTFVAGCTNGYIYYAPTADQLRNPGSAQEDCDCELAPEWQELFEDKVAEMLARL